MTPQLGEENLVIHGSLCTWIGLLTIFTHAHRWIELIGWDLNLWMLMLRRLKSPRSPAWTSQSLLSPWEDEANCLADHLIPLHYLMPCGSLWYLLYVCFISNLTLQWEFNEQTTLICKCTWSARFNIRSRASFTDFAWTSRAACIPSPSMSTYTLFSPLQFGRVC